MPTLPQVSSHPNHVDELPSNWDVIRWVPENAKRILEVGCRNGDNAIALKRTGRVIDGVANSAGEADVAIPHFRTVYLHNLEHGLPDAGEPRYDVIVAVHVLEHLCFPEKLLADIRARLEQGGLLIVAVPNLLNWKYRVKLVLGSLRGSRVADPTHFKRYTYDTCRQLLQQNGFKVLRAYAHGPLPMPVLRKIIPRRIAWRMDRTASFLFPGWFGYQLVYVATPRVR